MVRTEAEQALPKKAKRSRQCGPANWDDTIWAGPIDFVQDNTPRIPRFERYVTLPDNETAPSMLSKEERPYINHDVNAHTKNLQVAQGIVFTPLFETVVLRLKTFLVPTSTHLKAIPKLK